jgi:class 3 adenylate cyclase/CHASE2 domain-containing sensor protein
MDRFRPYRRSPRRLLNAGLLALAITGVLTAALWLEWLDPVEMRLLDWRFRERGRRTAPRELLLVALDDRTMNRARHLSPIPRELLAEIVRHLSDAGAKTIVLDVFLPDRRSDQEDRKLRDALLNAGNVILPAFINEQEELVRPHAYFEQVAAGVGLAHAEVTSVDHVVRWHQPVAEGIPSLSLTAYAHYSDRVLDGLLASPTPAALGRHLGQTLDATGRLLINFVGPAGALTRVSAADLLDDQIPRGTLKDKLVLVGGMWSGVQDLQFVPFGYWRANPHTRLMTGVEVQANCAASLLVRPPLRQASLPVDALCLLAIVLAASLIMVHFSPTAAALLSLALGILWMTTGLHLFVREDLFVRMAPSVAGIIVAYVASALVTERRAYHLRHHFRRYVGRPVADRIVEMSDEEIGRQGKERVATLLFSDIRGYTRFSAGLPPGAIVDFLNRYFTAMTAAVLIHNGFVDKYIGDGLMAVFGMFSTDKSGADGARDAARAALAMREALEQLRESDPDFRQTAIGIGLHTGRVIIGELGPSHRVDFTAIGSAVNLASRIEGATKNILETQKDPGHSPAAVILMSHVTCELIAPFVAVRSLGQATIRGLEDEEVQLWELQDLARTPPINRRRARAA